VTGDWCKFLQQQATTKKNYTQVSLGPAPQQLSTSIGNNPTKQENAQRTQDDSHHYRNGCESR